MGKITNFILNFFVKYIGNVGYDDDDEKSEGTQARISPAISVRRSYSQQVALVCNNWKTH